MSQNYKNIESYNVLLKQNIESYNVVIETKTLHQYSIITYL